MTAAAQPDIHTEYTFSLLAAGNPEKGLYEVATTTIARAGSWETAPPILDAGGTKWSRTTTLRYDGAGRAVYSRDIPGTENTTVHPSDQATAPDVTVYLGADDAGELLTHTVSWLDGQLKERTGQTITPEYADYTAGDYQLTSWHCHFAPATAGTSVVQDGLGRAILETGKVPIGTDLPQATADFPSARTYKDDGDGTITSRALPDPTLENPYHEVYATTHPTAYLSSRTVSRALSTDAAYDANDNDKNHAHQVTRYEKLGGVWYQVQELKAGQPGVTSAWTRTALGPLGFGSVTLDGVSWSLTALTETWRGGATRKSAEYWTSSQGGRTLSQTMVDGVVQLSIGASAGRAQSFATPRFWKMMTHTPLGKLGVGVLFLTIDALPSSFQSRFLWFIC